MSPRTSLTKLKRHQPIYMYSLTNISDNLKVSSVQPQQGKNCYKIKNMPSLQCIGLQS